MERSRCSIEGCVEAVDSSCVGSWIDETEPEYCGSVEFVGEAAGCWFTMLLGDEESGNS